MRILGIIFVVLFLLGCKELRNVPPEMGTTLTFDRTECKELTLASSVQYSGKTRIRIECTRVIIR